MLCRVFAFGLCLVCFIYWFNVFTCFNLYLCYCVFVMLCLLLCSLPLILIGSVFALHLADDFEHAHEMVGEVVSEGI